MTDEQNAVRNEIRAFREKHCYFLMSAAGASIAFGITQIDDLSPSILNILLFCSLFSWSYSFYCGHRFFMLDEGLLWANHEYLEMKREDKGKAYIQTNGEEAFRDLFKKSTKSDSAASEKSREKQFVYLCFGAAFFILWRVFECEQCLGFGLDSLPKQWTNPI